MSNTSVQESDSTTQSNDNKDVFSYDVTPYASHAFAKTHPNHLAALGKLFGLDAPDVSKARILELGGASGGNVIPLAYNYPKAKIINMDLGKVQIDEGQKMADDLGLKNIEMRHASITDIDESWGKFDYIICHGVFSWVPEDVQEHTLKICKENLSKNGIAYISFNTLPGWNSVRSIRDMMMFHAQRFEKPEDKAAQARSLLKFISDSLGGDTSTYKQMIDGEIEILKNQPDSYLLHEHLETHNKQYYFYEFMEMAGQHGLQYLSDAAIETMYTGNLPKDAAEKLSGVDNIIMCEQYMDFIRNRRFRSTLLCHADATLNRNINRDQILDFYLYAPDIEPEFAPDVIDWSKDQPLKFKGGLTSHDRTTAMLLTVLSQARKPIKASELTKQVQKKLKLDDENMAKASLVKIGIDLVLRGTIHISACDAPYITELSKKPKVSDLARYHAKLFDRTTNQRHELSIMEPAVRIVLPLFDGTRTMEDIEAETIALAHKGELTFNKEGKPVTDKKVIEQTAKQFIQQLAGQFCDRALLVA